MYCAYQNRKDLEDDLYQEDDGDSDGSEVNSELEFRLYSQLHYSSNAEGLEDRGEEAQDQDSQLPEVPGKSLDVDKEQEETGERRPLSPDVSKLLEHLEEKRKKKSGQKPDNQKKTDKLDKQKKGKSNSKSQKTSSSFFEEVIVIDSSPDIISISDDDTADDEGICSSKGRGPEWQQTSTPAQQGSQKRSHREPVTVVSSSSESDSSESESESESSDSSSDSDALENWMILGRGQQDGDHSISLNLEGGSDSNEDAEEQEGSWLVSSKDKEAQIYNKDKGARTTGQRLSNRYYTNKSVQCRNCNKNGHLSKNCPDPKKLSSCFLCGTPGHLVSECPNKHCNNCGLPGHLYNSCSERAYWHQRCERCNMTGHLFNSCPEIWRQYHITTKTGPPAKQQGGDRGRTPAYCYNCSKKGHFGHMCKQQRMFNGTYPSTPFINYYDTMKDIKCRQQWIFSKVKELKKNGYITSHPQTPLTPGPPRKKQKISYHKSNYQSNHTPRQTPNHHKPKGNHVFFSDNDDYATTKPKQYRHNKHKQQEGTGNVKPWKPKRPVPTSKDSLPKSKLILDEADDFPRGGGKGENKEKKRKRMNKKKQALAGAGGHRTGPGGTPGSNKEKGKRNWRNQARRNSDKKAAAQMYPTDENLFIIKQRKRSR